MLVLASLYHRVTMVISFAREHWYCWPQALAVAINANHFCAYTEIRVLPLLAEDLRLWQFSIVYLKKQLFIPGVSLNLYSFRSLNGTGLPSRAPIIKSINAVALSCDFVWSWIQRCRKRTTEVVANNYHLEFLHLVLQTFVNSHFDKI